jgi:hypothetical protein
MWHGGTNFEHFGTDYQTTSYDYDSPLSENGFKTLKYYHLKRLNEILNDYADLILRTDAISETQGWGKEIHVYGSSKDSKAIVFLCNTREQNDATFKFQDELYRIPQWSVSILVKGEDGKFSQIFTTSQVITSLPAAFVSNLNITTITNPNSTLTNLSLINTNDPVRSPHRLKLNHIPIGVIHESVGIWDSSRVNMSEKPMEQVNITKDKTEYMWYTTYQIPLELNDFKPLIVTLKKVTDVWYLWIDGVFASPSGISISSMIFKLIFVAEDKKPFDISFLIQPFEMKKKYFPLPKVHNITLLSSVISVNNFGAWFDKIYPKGLTEKSVFYAF